MTVDRGEIISDGRNVTIRPPVAKANSKAPMPFREPTPEEVEQGHHCPLCQESYGDFAKFAQHARPCIRRHRDHPAVEAVVRERGFATVDQLLAASEHRPDRSAG